jgi:hypothetical protein
MGLPTRFHKLSILVWDNEGGPNNAMTNSIAQGFKGNRIYELKDKVAGFFKTLSSLQKNP